MAGAPWFDTAFLVVVIVAPLFGSAHLRMVAELAKAHDKIQQLPITDEITQACRRYLAEVAAQERV
jgi:hypothetical protein